MTDIEKLACSMSYEKNLLKLAEEMGELTQALSKVYSDETQATRQAVVEEMVDVQICMDVVKCLLRIDDAQIIDMRYHKMQRNLQRIDYGKKCESREAEPEAEGRPEAVGRCAADLEGAGSTVCEKNASCGGD